MDKKVVIIVFLLLGAIFRLLLTSNGNFIFNMDNARDMVDVREMIVLKKPRLTGPNTPIPGVFDGPGWYYLLAIPFIVTSGDPHGSIVMQVILWMIGGFFLLKLVSKLGILAMLSVGSLWVSSNYIVLASVYAFNPNPVLFLSPALLFLIKKYITTQELIYGALMWFLGGLLFNFEMNFGVFVPLIIIFSIIFSKKTFIFKDKKFWIGVCFFLICLLPQLLFDLKHEFIITKGLIAHVSAGAEKIDYINRFQNILTSFYNVFVPTILNVKLLSTSILVLSPILFFRFLKQQKKDPLAIITLVYIFTPFIVYLFLPVAVNPWHLGAEMVAAVILIGFLLRELQDINLLGKLTSVSLTCLIVLFAFKNYANFFINDLGKPSNDPSVLKNEIAAIDFVYKYADGKNFKVYTYLPSIYDYPYQYLIWWHGLKKYGYLPADYAYEPEKFEYISSKQFFSATKEELKMRENSDLVFLIKEPNRNYTRYGWEGDLIKYNWETIEKIMVGPIEIEIRKE